MRGPRAKVERAKKHVGELQATLSGLVYSHTNNPDEIVTEDEPQTGNRLYKIGEIPKIPDEIATIAGDTVHNLRASLDLLFGQLVVANGETVGEDYFPISNTRQKFVTRCKSQIKPPYRGRRFQADLHDRGVPWRQGGRPLACTQT